MLNALRGCQTEYLTAKWYEKDRIGEYKLIRLSIVSDKEKQFNPIINRIAERSGMIIRTSYNYDYRRNQNVFLLGLWWKITEVTDDTKSYSPQSMRLTKPRPFKILGLVETKAT